MGRACLRKQAPSSLGWLSVRLESFLLDPLAAVITLVSILIRFRSDHENSRGFGRPDALPIAVIMIIPRPYVREPPAPK